MENVRGVCQGLQTAPETYPAAAGAYQGPAPVAPSVMVESEPKLSSNVFA